MSKCQVCGADVAVTQEHLCPACLNPTVTAIAPPVLPDNPDYYCEGDTVVFTREYHLKRGYCCHSSEAGCRHCPYR